MKKSQILLHINNRIEVLEKDIGKGKGNIAAVYKLGYPKEETERYIKDHERWRAKLKREKNALKEAYTFIADHLKE